MEPRAIMTTQISDKRPAIDIVHELLVDYVERQFERHGDLWPTWIVSGEKAIYWFETPWESDREQQAHMLGLGVVIESNAVDCFAVAVTGVAVMANADAIADTAKRVRRGEEEGEHLLMVTTISRSGRSLFTRYLIRSIPGKPDRLGLRVDEPEFQGHAEGPLCDMFDGRRAEAFLDAAAQAIKERQRRKKSHE